MVKKLRLLERRGELTVVPVYRRGEILESVIDTADAPAVGKYLWSMTAAGYPKTSHKGASFGGYLHRLIMQPKPIDQVDHINGNRLDNRRSNLRLVTNQQNQMARHAVGGASGYKGVHYRGGTYRAHIKFNQKIIHLGGYPTAVRAAKAYNQAAVALFGEHAVINHIDYRR